MHTRLRNLVSSLLPLGATLSLAACGSSQQPSLAALPFQSNATSEKTFAAPAKTAAPIFHTYTAGKTKGFPAGAVAADITAGPDGAMWFTDPSTPAIGRISAAGNVTEYTTGLIGKSRPASIVAGTDGNLWFSDSEGAIGRITTAGAIVEYSIERFSKAASPDGIAVGNDGAIWSIAPGPPNLLVRVGANGQLSVFKVPARLAPDGSLAADAAGNLWMMTGVVGGQNGIMLQRKPGGGFVDHKTGLVRAETLCCPNLAPKRIVIGPDGNPWYTTLYWLRANAGGNVIATTTPSGTTLFKLNKTNMPFAVYPSGITAKKNDVWFVGDDPFQVQGGLWHIDESGNQVGYVIPYNPIGIAPDASGNLWITADAFDNPAQIVEAVFAT
jgi:virginiamycin B lyase